MSELSDVEAIVKVALKGGGRTFQIAKRLTSATGRLWSTERTRLALRKLEAAGDVYRDQQFTYANDIYWRPATPAQKGRP